MSITLSRKGLWSATEASFRGKRGEIRCINELLGTHHIINSFKQKSLSTYPKWWRYGFGRPFECFQYSPNPREIPASGALSRVPWNCCGFERMLWDVHKGVGGNVPRKAGEGLWRAWQEVSCRPTVKPVRFLHCLSFLGVGEVVCFDAGRFFSYWIWDSEWIDIPLVGM